MAIPCFSSKNNTSKNKILNDEYSNEYKKQVGVYNDFLHNLNYLKKIIFYRLWSANPKFSLEFIRDFLTDEELNIYNAYLKSITQNLCPINTLNVIKNDQSFSQASNISSINNEISNNEIDNLLEKIKMYLKEQSDFDSFNIFLNDMKNISKNFRRSGINFDLNNVQNIKTFINSYKSLNGIKEFVFKYLIELDLRVKNLKSQFNKDKDIFFNNFKKLHFEKE